MADVRGFRAFRYDLGKVGTLSEVVAPPYDVIDPALQAKLYAASPYNAVRLELTTDEPGDNENDNKYTRAARTLNDWLSSDILRQDSARSLYVYEQEFTVEGQTFQRRGFLARVKLEPFGTGRIFPHEQTLSGPKADRLKLYQATGFNISPIFGLYPDAEGEVFQHLEPLIRRQPPIVATDHLGVVNRLWVVTDTTAISHVVGAMGPLPIFIADGHHRYETGLKYLELQREAGLVADDESAPNFCLMMLVGMNDPGLRILPTHRLIRGLPSLSSEQLLQAISPSFEVLGEFANASDCWAAVESQSSQAILGFGTVADGKWLAVELRDFSAMDSLSPEHSPEWRMLAVSVLHRLVLVKLLANVSKTVPNCQYVHLLREVDEAVQARSCDLVALVPPVSMEHVELIAGNRETMPPKSTYFYPKILTGLVYNSLKKD